MIESTVDRNVSRNEPRVGKLSFTPARIRIATATFLVWAIWGTLTVATLLFIKTYSRNIPYWDDFSLVDVMVGHQAIDLPWLWSLQNEHRPFVPRLILAGLLRFIAHDFRVPMYFNAGLLSLAAGSMLLVARRIRGTTQLTDMVIPLSILNMGQAETLLIGFAMNLVLTALITYQLIAIAAVADRERGWKLTARFGTCLMLLPVCGGSGLVMLPPLVPWLLGYIAWGWWSGRDPDGSARFLGVCALMASSAIVALYLSGYAMPSHHRPPPTGAAILSTTLEFLSLVIRSPNDIKYWYPASLFVVFLVVVTLGRLTVVGFRQPEQRPRSLAFIAVIVSLLMTAGAVGVSRSFMGPGIGNSSRYVTIAAPLLCAIYFAWLSQGSSLSRRLAQTALLGLVAVAIPANVNQALTTGQYRRLAFQRVEQSVKRHDRFEVILGKASPALSDNPADIERCFRVLKDAGIGAFPFIVDDDREAATGPGRSTAVR
jgi:hypothetical protein